MAFVVAGLLQVAFVTLLLDPERDRLPISREPMVVCLLQSPATARTRADAVAAKPVVERRPRSIASTRRAPRTPPRETVDVVRTLEPDGPSGREAAADRRERPLDDREGLTRDVRALERERRRTSPGNAFEAAMEARPVDPMARAVEKAIRPDCKEAYRRLSLLAIPFLVHDTVTGTGCKW